MLAKPANVRKHGGFADDPVFEDDLALRSRMTPMRRFVTLGIGAFGRLLVVVYTYRGEDSIRLISARKATANERQQYEDKHERRIRFQEGRRGAISPLPPGKTRITIRWMTTFWSGSARKWTLRAAAITRR